MAPNQQTNPPLSIKFTDIFRAHSKKINGKNAAYTLWFTNENPPQNFVNLKKERIKQNQIYFLSSHRIGVFSQLLCSFHPSGNVVHLGWCESGQSNPVWNNQFARNDAFQSNVKQTVLGFDYTVKTNDATACFLPFSVFFSDEGVKRCR